MANRCSSITRKTAETDIIVELCLDGDGKSKINSGSGFFDHMMTLFSKHGTVTDVHLPTDRESGQPRGFAFVTMDSKDAMNAAMSAINGSPPIPTAPPLRSPTTFSAAAPPRLTRPGSRRNSATTPSAA